MQVYNLPKSLTFEEIAVIGGNPACSRPRYYSWAGCVDASFITKGLVFVVAMILLQMAWTCCRLSCYPWDGFVVACVTTDELDV